MEIRPATLDHLPTLTKLFEAYRLFYRMEPQPARAHSFLEQRILKRDSAIFLALVEDHGVGFVQLYPQLSSTRMNTYWLLNDLFVDPGHRGKGISRLLIDRAKQHCVENEGLGLLLETEKTNIIANQLYPSCGFSPYEDTRFYWWENK